MASADHISERSGYVNEVGAVTLANQTQISFEPELAFYFSPQLQWGLVEDLDLLVIVGADFGSQFSTDPGLAVVRYEFIDGLAIGLGGTFPIQDDGTYVGIHPGLCTR